MLRRSLTAPIIPIAIGALMSVAILGARSRRRMARRTCVTCHRPDQGWTITPESAGALLPQWFR